MKAVPPYPLEYIYYRHGTEGWYSCNVVKGPHVAKILGPTDGLIRPWVKEIDNVSFPPSFGVSLHLTRCKIKLVLV